MPNNLSFTGALIFSLLFLIIIVFSCAPNLYRPAQEDVSIAKFRWPNSEFTDLEKGRKMYIDNCAGCHYLHYPREYKDFQWDTIVPSMQHRSKGKIHDSTANYVLKYLYVASRHPDKASH